MRRLPYSISTLGGVVLASSALLCGSAIAQSAATDTTNSATASASSSKASLNKDDQKMLKDLAQANMAEIDAGKLALSKSNDDQVKAFAQKMVDEHTQALQQVQQLAQSKNVKLPSGPDTKHKTMKTTLSALSGETFDKQYLEHDGVKDHQQAHALVARIQNKATDPDLKALGAKLAPTIDQHFAMAKDLNTSKSGSSSSHSSASGSSSSKPGSSSSSSGTSK